MKKRILLSLAMVISFVFVASAIAQASTTRPILINKRASTTVASSTIIADKCKILTTKVDTQIAKFNNNKERHVKVFTALTNKVSVIINSLDAKGVDTGNLKADLAILTVKIDKFKTDYQAYIEKLGLTKDFACGASSGQFMSKFNEAKKSLVLIRKDILDINNFYQTVMRPDIKQIRDQLKATRTTTTPKLKLNIKGSSTSIVE